MSSLDTLSAGMPGEASAMQQRLSGAVRRLAWSAAKIAALVAATGLALEIASMMVPAQDAAPAHAAAGHDAWIDINRPIQLFGLVGTEFSKMPLAYAAERRAGGSRRDLLWFGAIDGGAPFLALSFDRIGQDADPPQSLIEDLGRIDQPARLSVERLGTTSNVSTRFGSFETADLKLETDRQSKACMGFRSMAQRGAVLRISGLACGTMEHPVGREAVGCVIDRIDLLSAGSDEALKSLFVEAERRRGSGCAPASVVTPGLARITWLDASRGPLPLKGPAGDRQR